jgi:CheY-like chemotaxis protein
VVDDGSDVGIYLCTLIEDAGFSVLEAADGEAAMDIIRNQKPDFISLDLMMPKKSGHKLLYELQHDKVLSKIPVMIVTGHGKHDLGPGGAAETPEVNVLSGPGMYLEKPVNPATYIQRIEQALGLEIDNESNDESDDVESLQRALQDHMKNASKEALEEALKILRRPR